VLASLVCDNQSHRTTDRPLDGSYSSDVELLKIVPTDVPGTLRLVGELDISNVESVQARLEEELADNGRLSLDTSELAFMDSQGIRMLIMLGEQALAQESAIVILNCSKAVRRSLDVSVPKGIPGVELVKTDT
jgi:anti-anti-sigma factor